MADGVDVERGGRLPGPHDALLHVAPGRWDLDDPDQVAQLVRTELLAGVVAGPEPERDPARPGSLTMRQIEHNCFIVGTPRGS